MKTYQAWKKYHTNIELWFAWTFTSFSDYDTSFSDYDTSYVLSLKE